MTTLIFELPDGSCTELQARDGHTIMATAVAHGIRGIVAECGGAMACATCHVIIRDQDAFDRTGQRSNSEEVMLEFAATPMQATSRLSCQITVTPDLEGMVVKVPDSQT